MTPPRSGDGAFPQEDVRIPAPSAPEVASCSGRVLSIQSHTVHGYVGNKCAVFPLQLHGFDVDAVNSVQFSNHTGYPSFKGSVMSGQDLETILEGLQANQLLVGYTHLLTGYIGSVSLLQSIKKVLAELRAANPNLVYVCDPVMGDSGRLYVAEPMVAAFKEEVLPLATVLTPNAFEAELLTGRSIRSTADALAACQELHARGPSTVVITSMDEDADGTTDAGTSSSSTSDAADSIHRGRIAVVASTTAPQHPGRPSAVLLTVPKIDAYFTGTGDLLSALLLAWLHKCPGDLATAVERSIAALQLVLGATVAAAGPAAVASKARDAQVCAARELKLIECRAALVDAPVLHKAHDIDG